MEKTKNIYKNIIVMFREGDGALHKGSLFGEISKKAVDNNLQYNMWSFKAFFEA